VQACRGGFRSGQGLGQERSTNRATNQRTALLPLILFVVGSLPFLAGMGAAAVFETGGEVDNTPRRPVGSQLAGLSRDAQVA
jgi:hypothetical protein